MKRLLLIPLLIAQASAAVVSVRFNTATNVLTHPSAANFRSANGIQASSSRLADIASIALGTNETLLWDGANFISVTLSELLDEVTGGADGSVLYRTGGTWGVQSMIPDVDFHVFSPTLALWETKTVPDGEPVGTTDVQTLEAKKLKGVSYIEVLHAAAGADVEIDAAAANFHRVQLNAPTCEVSIINLTSGAYSLVHVFFEQDGTGGRAVTYAVGSDPDDPDPTIDTSPNAVTHVVFYRHAGETSIQSTGSVLGVGDIPDLTDILDQASSTQGSLLFRNATDWVALPNADAAGKLLQSGGPGANPSWVAPSGTATPTYDTVFYTNTAHGAVGATQEFSAAIASHTATLDDNVTVTLTGWPTSGTLGEMVIEFTQDGAGNRTVTWPAAVTTPPQINPAAGSKTVVNLRTINAGTNILAWSDYAGAVTVTTIDTGQGAAEVYLQDQNLRTTDSPTFAAVTVGAEAYGAGWDGDNTAAPKNDVYDKIEALGAGSGLGYTMVLNNFGSINPADGSTYILGAGTGGTTTGTLTWANSSIQVPKAGTIKRLWIKGLISSVGTNETVSHWVRLNDTTDVGQVDLTYDVTAPTGTNSSISQAVVAGDLIALKITMPTFATNPTGTRIHAIVYIE